MQGRRRIAVVLVATVVLGSGSTAVAKIRCSPPSGWHVVTRDAQAVVIGKSVLGNLGPVTRTLRFCVRGDAQNWHPLAATPSDDPWGVGAVLRGFYAVVTLAAGQRYPTDGRSNTPIPAMVRGRLVNLATGRSWNLAGWYQTCNDTGSPSYEQTPTGIAVWLVPCGLPAPASTKVFSFDSHTGRTTVLGTATATLTSTFFDLQIQRCVSGCTPAGAYFAWWVYGDNVATGTWRAAALS